MGLPRSPRTQLALGLAVLLLCLGIVSARVLVDGRQALRSAEAALEKGDTLSAIFELQMAAQAHLPLGPYHSVAFDRLFEIGTLAESAGNNDIARRAYEAFRAAALGTRSFYMPQAARLDEIETRLARLYASWEQQAANGANAKDAVNFYAEHLAKRPGPRLALVLLALGGLFLWIGAVCAFVLFGLDAGMVLRKGPALASAGGFILGFVMFVVGLRG